jgi:hypothetical protein
MLKVRRFRGKRRPSQFDDRSRRFGKVTFAERGTMTRSKSPRRLRRRSRVCAARTDSTPVVPTAGGGGATGIPPGREALRALIAGRALSSAGPSSEAIRTTAVPPRDPHGLSRVVPHLGFRRTILVATRNLMFTVQARNRRVRSELDEPAILPGTRERITHDRAMPAICPMRNSLHRNLG